MGSSHKKKHRHRSATETAEAVPETLESRAEVVRTPRRNLADEFSLPGTPASKSATADRSAGSPLKRDRPTSGGKSVLVPKQSIPGPVKAPLRRDESGSDPFVDDDAPVNFLNQGPTSRGTKRKKPQVAQESSGSSEDSDSAPKDLAKPSDLKYLTKPTDSKNLRTVRPAPCTNCIRGIVQESFTAHAHRCWDMMHETRAGVINKLCSECSRKHLKFCESVPSNLVSDAQAVYDAYDSEGRTSRVLQMASDLISKLPERRSERRGMKRERSVDESEVGSPVRPAFVGGPVPASQYSAAIGLLSSVNGDKELPQELRNAVSGIIGKWIGLHHGV